MSKRTTDTAERARLQFKPQWLALGLGVMHNTTHEGVPGEFLTDRPFIETWLRSRPDIDADGFRAAWADWLDARAIIRGETEFG
jgi:hypothetical protein